MLNTKVTPTHSMNVSTGIPPFCVNRVGNFLYNLMIINFKRPESLTQAVLLRIYIVEVLVQGHNFLYKDLMAALHELVENC